MQANQDKSRFLAGASHDLRQPLQAMALNVGALRHVPLADDARAIVDVVDSSLDQLRSMLDALMDASKLDAGVVAARPRRVQLDRLIAAVTASFGATAAARGVALDAQCPAGLAVCTDPDLLRRLLGNLIDNAIKFSPAGGNVRVLANADAEGVDLSVQDDGPGIAAEHHRIIFEDLVQLEPASGQRSTGHGLGLGIVRRLVQLLALSLTLESDSGKGARFRLRLPLASADATDDDAVEDAHLTGRVVLVLDDDPMVRGAYLNALRTLGCMALPAATLPEALAHCVGDTPPDAAVVDYRLGEDTDGFIAIDRLRTALPQLPVVMVTADASTVLAEAARQRSVPLLHKPVDSHTLGRTLTGALMSR